MLWLSIGSMFAQWSTDPAQTIDVSGNEIFGQTNVKARLAPNGNIFALWGVGEEVNYHTAHWVRAQLLDAEGKKLWGDDGILVCKNISDPWILEHGLAVTADGCLVFTSNDKRSGMDKMYAYMIDQEGNHVWGEDGIALPGKVSGIIDKTIVTVQGDYTWIGYFASNDGETPSGNYLCKLNNKDGSFVWEEKVRNVTSVDAVMPAGETEILLGYMTSEILRVERLDGEAKTIWSVDVDPRWIKYDGLNFASDGNGGCLVTYSRIYGEDAFGNPISTVTLQHVSASGELLFGETPIDGTNQEMGDNTFPLIAADPLTGDAFVVWFYDDFDYTYRLCMNKFKDGGESLWSEEAKVLYERDMLGGYEMRPLAIYPQPEGECVMVYNDQDNYISNRLVACRLNADGSIKWEQDLGIVEMNEFYRDATITDGKFVYAFWSREDLNDPMEGTGVVGHQISYDGAFSDVQMLTSAEEMSIRYVASTGGLVFKGMENGAARIYNLQGMQVFSGSLKDSCMSVKGLASGIYLVRAIDKNGVVKAQKIVL